MSEGKNVDALFLLYVPHNRVASPRPHRDDATTHIRFRAARGDAHNRRLRYAAPRPGLGSGTPRCGRMERPPRLLSSPLWLHGRRCDVCVSGAALTWTAATGRTRIPGRAGSHCVPVCEIVGVQEAAGRSQKSEPGRWPRVLQKPDKSQQPAFTVSYVGRGRQHRWRCSEVTFHCADWSTCHQWVQTIQEQLSLLTNRPKRLLVYVNPFGGKQRGRQIYEQKVAPVFSRAAISADVIVTERANHARDHLKTEAELKEYDGVVCVGGDGMFSEIVHGLISRTQLDSGVDQDSPEETLVPCSLRIGIIPAGSTDCICYATVGANDPVTSALHIVVGDCQPLDVCSVHHDDALLRYSLSLLGYGFYGDVLTDSEKKRWMGPARYDFSGLKTFLTHHQYEGTVSYLPATGSVGSPRDRMKCRSGCHVCQHNSPLPSVDSLEDETKAVLANGGPRDVWQVVRGKFVAINAASMSCACPRSPKGLSPSAHLSDGTTDLILVRKCSRLDFLRHLLRHTNKDDQFDHPFVEVHRVRRFRFAPRHHDADSELDLRDGGKGLFGQICRDHPACGCAAPRSTWSCDGETLPHTSIQVRVHSKIIQLFARGIEERPAFQDPGVLYAA
ncbi:ceramide kinase isoform X2 [Denticeps clupeoides]|uniref:ceramide kinase isoform X2 n=1 Tax=Denticeps clupeoides TaxID=299321 RepID=UPI0010A478F9|nr:ceramide kinase isoform X2 [Denticeps clupeoides]